MRWLQTTYLALTLAALLVISGIGYWEYQFLAGLSPGRNEFREGAAYFVVYGWPIFVCLGGLTFFKREKFSRFQLIFATLLVLTFVGYVGFSVL